MAKTLLVTIIGTWLLVGCGNGSRDRHASHPLSQTHGSNEFYSYVYEAKNFWVYAHDPAVARQVAHRAEEARRDISMTWFGSAPSDWSEPAIITVPSTLENLGETSFLRHQDTGRAYDWQVKLRYQSWGFLADNVIPHEVNHIILSDAFPSIVPRWLDEGAAVSAESDESLAQQLANLSRYRADEKTFSVSELFSHREYPDKEYIGSFYAHGASLVNFMIQNLGGREKLVDYIEASNKLGGNWEQGLKQVYELDVSVLDKEWQESLSEDTVL